MYARKAVFNSFIIDSEIIITSWFGAQETSYYHHQS